MTGARIGLGIVVFFVAIALLAPWLSPYDPSRYTGDPVEGPSRAHWLGTNDLGQDNLSELIWGARRSVPVCLAVGLASMALATAVGLVAGVYGGWIDRVLMKLADCVLIVPRLPLILVLAGYWGPNLFGLILVLTFFSWAKGAKVIRSKTLTVNSEPHVEAVKVLGASRAYIILRHVLPEILPLSAVKFLRSSRYALAAESGLAFLGLSDPTAQSWGMMLHYAQAHPEVYFSSLWLWWIGPPALCLMLLSLAFVAIGYSVEAAVNPRIRRSRRQARPESLPCYSTSGA